MEAPRSPVELTRPLPPDVAAGEFGTGLFYEKYATFSWPWAWRRTLLLGAIAVPWGSLLGLVHGLFAHNVVEGLMVGWRAAFANLLLVGLGPALAASVRHARPRRAERLLVVVAVLLGIVVAAAAAEYAIAFHDRIMGEPVTRLERLAQVVSGGVPAHAMVSRAADVVATLGLYAVAGGVLALRAYLHEPRRWREHEARLAAQAERQGKLDAERRLALLQAQVEPHFLFNTLATVRSLIEREPHRAAEMIDALAVHLRATLPRIREGAAASISTLREQFEICRTFLALMELRLGGRLTVGIDLPETLAEVRFPPMLLISLVENAVRHGVEGKVGRARIELSARRRDAHGEPMLEVAVADDGMGLREGLTEGTGLSNVRGQLTTLFGAAAALLIESRPSGGVRASIMVPLGGLEA